ncbi:hypothetical protein [Bacillus sp. JJ1122]|uniref:hypothetical protein n=1 Tax=Bacillus sp. JJ1122 TaxID=3122951 RepID=UPI002FFE4AF1
MKKIINETLQSLKDYIPKLLNANEQITELLQTDNEIEAFNLFLPVIEGLEWVAEALNSMQKLQQIEGFDTSGINNILQEVNKALEIRDFVLIADLFEYEINPILLNWFNKVSEIIE